MEHGLNDKALRFYFRASVIIKGVISLFELLGGLAVLIFPPAAIGGIIIGMSLQELAEEPGDFIATHSLAIAQQFSLASGAFLAVYLISRGVIKLGLVAAPLKEQLWAYPASLLVLGLFIIYQVYEIVVGHSLLMVVITAFDLFVVYFIWREYLAMKAFKRAQAVSIARPA